MNDKIIENLYEFWAFIGRVNDSIIANYDYSYVKVSDSDWPNRIYDFKSEKIDFDEIISGIKNGYLPNAVVIDKSNSEIGSSELLLFLEQENMALDLEKYKITAISNVSFEMVKTPDSAEHFAETASSSFNYHVNKDLIYSLTSEPGRVKMYNAHIDGQYLGCGIIYFDSYGNAGLHMIGTKPGGRGKGIGKAMTSKLLNEAKKSGSSHCVLHASKMGKPIYSKLGFDVYGEIKTYKL